MQFTRQIHQAFFGAKPLISWTLNSACTGVFGASAQGRTRQFVEANGNSGPAWGCTTLLVVNRLR